MTNAERSLQTKQALANALKKAMEKKSLSKISVAELVKTCNLNRKTFYYHFQDIYDLLKWTLDQEAVDVLKNFDLVNHTEAAIRFVMDYIDANQYIINGAFDTLGYEAVKHFFYQDLFSAVLSVIDQSEKDLNLQIDSDFKHFLASFYTEATAGLIINWAKKTISQDKETVLKDLLSIYKISIPAILENKTRLIFPT